MTQTENITLNDGAVVTVPADASLMTNFVLKEQGDWFEKENWINVATGEPCGK